MGLSYQDPGRVFHKVGDQMVVFEAANQDNADATYHYYGYISADGAWMVQRFKYQTNTIIYGYFGGQAIATYNALWHANGTYIGALTFGRYDEIKDL